MQIISLVQFLKSVLNESICSSSEKIAFYSGYANQKILLQTDFRKCIDIFFTNWCQMHKRILWFFFNQHANLVARSNLFIISPSSLYISYFNLYMYGSIFQCDEYENFSASPTLWPRLNPDSHLSTFVVVFFLNFENFFKFSIYLLDWGGENVTENLLSRWNLSTFLRLFVIALVSFVDIFSHNTNPDCKTFLASVPLTPSHKISSSLFSELFAT